MMTYSNNTLTHQVHHTIKQGLLLVILFSVFFTAFVHAEPAPSSLKPVVNQKTQIDTLITHLRRPWSMAFLPDQDGILITEKEGHLRLWTPRSGLSEPIKGVPAVYSSGQGGLLDVAIDPDFLRNHRVYLSYAEADASGKAGTVVGYGVLNKDSLHNFKVIFRQAPKLSVGNHFGSRLAFERTGHLYISLGENNQRPTAQLLDHLQGKIVRINMDGDIPTDNPLIQDQSRSSIWAYGIRNPQGLAFNPWTNELWETEHGPRGGDEINIIRPGKNYGWPIATYGKDYSGFAISEAKGNQVEGTEQPIYYWQKSPAISGMAFYQHARFPQWQHSLFIGALAQKMLIRLTINQQQVTHEEWLLTENNARIRDVRVGPDGYVYVLTDENEGKLLRIQPAS